MSERDWINGNRAAWVHILNTALGELGYDQSARKTPARSVAQLAAEREAVIASLRSLCAEYGDNDWDESLHLADVVEHHLVRPMRERKR